MAESKTPLAKVTLQIAVSDFDVAYLRLMLPHQLRVLGRHADDVLLSVNRFKAPQDPGPLDRILTDAADAYPNVRIAEVDYSRESQQWVSETFFGGRSYPLFDYTNIPIHAFLEQIRQARHSHFMALAPDLLLGGSGPWFDDAIAVLTNRPNALVVNPLAGPPSPSAYQSGANRITTEFGGGFELQKFSGRLWLVHLDEFLPAMANIQLVAPRRIADRLQARAAGYSMVGHMEDEQASRLADTGKFRIDMGGTGGLWTLHPVHKTPSYIAALPDLISSVENGDVPEAQRGLANLHASMLHQSDIPRRRHRALRMSKQLSARLQQTLGASRLLKKIPK